MIIPSLAAVRHQFCQGRKKELISLLCNWFNSHHQSWQQTIHQ